MGIAATLNDKVVDGWARLHRRQRIRGLPLDAKVNLGSGMVVAPGWVNLDVSLASMVARWPGVFHKLVYRIMPQTSATKRLFTEQQFCDVLRSRTFVHHDVRFGLPLADASVQFLYTSHFLEHLYRSEALELLREARRVLRQGGVLRVCVPDLDYALSLFAGVDRARALEFFFYDRDVSSFTRHRYMWDFAMLSDALRAAGFATVERCRFQQGRTPDLAILDNRPDETLYVEALT
jgi:SAM-dependent methyltransferase